MAYCRTVKVGETDITITFKDEKAAFDVTPDELYKMGVEFIEKAKNAKPMEEIPF
jgi:hypothetical protein